MGLRVWGENSTYPALLWVRLLFALAPSPQIHLKSTNFRSRSTSSYRLAVPFPNSRFLNKYTHNHRIASRYIGSIDQIQRAYQSQTCLPESYHLPSSKVCHRLRKNLALNTSSIVRPIRVSSQEI